MDEWSFDRLWKAEHFGTVQTKARGGKGHGMYREWVVLWHRLCCRSPSSIAKPWVSHLPDPNPPNLPSTNLIGFRAPPNQIQLNFSVFSISLKVSSTLANRPFSKPHKHPPKSSAHSFCLYLCEHAPQSWQPWWAHPLLVITEIWFNIFWQAIHQTPEIVILLTWYFYF